MSATQPLIFLPEKEIQEIVPDYKSYFGLFNRTKLINRARECVSLAHFVDDVVEYINEYPSRDVLLIMNTKASCLKVFETLKGLINITQCELYYMSTLITPYERKRIIDLMKNKGSDKQRIVVTTQLIEAGVDISVDAVFRVLAPIDALIQAAGRANRYNEKDRVCEVFIYEIEESERGSKMVYGTDLLLKTQNVLKGITEIEESQYLQLIEAYFQEVRKHSDTRINENLGHIEQLAFASLGQFSLIEERFTESLFVQLNLKAKNVWEQYCQIYHDKETSIFEKRLAFGKIKSAFYDFVVNIPVPHGEKEIAFDSEPVLGFRLVRLEQPSDFYTYSETDFLENTGYKELKTIMS